MGESCSVTGIQNKISNSLIIVATVIKADRILVIVRDICCVSLSAQSKIRQKTY